MHDLLVRRSARRRSMLALGLCCVLSGAALAQKDAAAPVQPLPTVKPVTPIKVIPRTGTAKPDLIVDSASVEYSGVCKPYSVWANATVTVRNIGTAASPARTDVGVVQVVDYRDVTLTAGYRGQGVGLGALAPGEARTVKIGVAYPVGELGNGGKVVSYFARVNFGNWIDESNTANNRLPDRITITPPAGECPGDPPKTEPAKADLIVESARISYSGVCRPGSVWANASVTVRNIGTAVSGSRPDVGMVQVVDARDIDLPSNYRGQGVGLVALAPGQSGTLTIPISYPSGETGYGGKVVSYFARVNFGNWIDESNTTNNRLPDRITFVPSAADCP